MAASAPPRMSAKRSRDSSSAQILPLAIGCGSHVFVIAQEGTLEMQTWTKPSPAPQIARCAGVAGFFLRHGSI